MNSAPNTNHNIFAIIPAGGIGKRMNQRRPKQFLTIFDQPILLVTLKILAQTGLIKKFIIPTVDVITTKKIIASKLSDVDIEIIKGGKTRQDSVHNGLDYIKKLDDQPDLVLVHDAVRVLVSQEIVINTIEKAFKTGAAIAANKVYDTLKLSHSEVGEDITIKKNISRENTWQAPTPQVFKKELIIEAYQKAKKDHFEGTDSASLVERLNVPVSLVESPKSNYKITTPEDLEIAELILSKRLPSSKS